MIRSPNFHVRKRKWKTVLFLLRKRKRNINEEDDGDDVKVKPPIDDSRWNSDDNGGDVRDVNPRNDVDRKFEGLGTENPRIDVDRKFEGFGMVNPRLGLDNDDYDDADSFGVYERDINPRNDVDRKLEEFGDKNPRLGLDNNDEGDAYCSGLDDEIDVKPRNDVDWESEGSGKENPRLGLDHVVGGEEVDESLKSALTVVSERKKDGGDTPPDDDCCPICFDSFSIACKTNCGHWFCANCILQFWTYRTVLKKCNCPICARPISKLTPEPSLLMMHEAEVVEVLKNVRRYNRLFQGGVNGVIRKVFEVPNLFKRMLCGLTDPDRFRGNYYAMRSFALLMSCIYNIGSFEFIPTGTLGVRRLFDLCAISLVVILCLVGICHRLVLRQRVRRLAANQL